VLTVSSRRAPTMLCTFPADLKSLTDDLWFLLTGGHLIHSATASPTVIWPIFEVYVSSIASRM
jgi:hypothetical protein